MKKIFNIAAVLIGALVLSAGTTLIYAGTFTEPACGPTGCNTSAPIDVSSADQVKLGGLGVSNLSVAANATAGYLYVTPQNAGGGVEGGEIQLQGAGSNQPFQIDNYNGNARIFTLATGKTFQVIGGSIYADGTTANNYFAGNVGVGTNNPSKKFEVNGDAKVTQLYANGADIGTGLTDSGINFKNTNTFNMAFTGGTLSIYNPASVGSNMNMTVYGNTFSNAYFYTSDKNLKKNIAPITNALDKITSLQGVTFNWKSDGKPSVGLIAQDVEKVFPELVNTDEKSGLKSVEYGNLVGPLIEAVKAQQKEIEALKAQVDKLSK